MLGHVFTCLAIYEIILGVLVYDGFGFYQNLRELFGSDKSFSKNSAISGQLTFGHGQS